MRDTELLMDTALGFYEFFAGGGLARIGLGADWRCLFANDIAEKKARTYRANFTDAQELVVKDIATVDPPEIPAGAVLAWASFPCQDVSLAGNGRGLSAERTGTFWSFWSLMTALDAAGRGVPLIVLENVPGLLTANQGRDFEELIAAFVTAGYRPGACIIDAVHFVPQSRPRLFVVAVKESVDVDQQLLCQSARVTPWHPSAVQQAFTRLPGYLQRAWLWWYLPPPPPRVTQLRDIIQLDLQASEWHTSAETERLVAMMSSLNLAKIAAAQASGQLHIGTIYKRIRHVAGVKQQRAEVRFDDISGCLRTPTGGSSRQIVLVVRGDQLRSRLLTVREAARLMGLPDSYVLPTGYNDGYHVMGDAVVAPVVAWLEQRLLRPIATTIMAASLVAVDA
jgi:DNA (cytosine-5)-methyltransferase 1